MIFSGSSDKTDRSGALQAVFINLQNLMMEEGREIVGAWACSESSNTLSE